VNLGYGLGWMVNIYRDNYYLEHGGGIDGFTATVSLFPNKSIGIVVLSNNITPLSNVVNYYAADIMLEKEPIDWTSRMKGGPGDFAEGEKEKKKTKPSHDMIEYAGTYEHPGYGVITVKYSDGTLNYSQNGVFSPMKHLHYDTFEFTDERVNSMYGNHLPTFITGADGKITSISLKLEPNVDEIVFKKEATVREYIVKRTSGEIILDGKLNEKGWKNAAFTEDFVIHQNGAKATYSTKAKLLWDDKNLYIAFSVNDNDIWSTMEKHDEYLYTQEAVEMLIDPDGDGLNYLELQVNSLGTTLDLLMSREYSKGGSADLNWTLEGFEAEVKVDGKINDEKGRDKGWICEIAIPFEGVSFSAPTLNYPPKEGDSWRVNLCRIENIRGKNRSQEAVSWNQTDGRGFHAADKMGRIIFSVE